MSPALTLLLTTLMLGTPVSIAAQKETQQWLCVTDKSTGFAFRDGEWKQANFAGTNKYLVRFVGEKNNVRSIRRIGEEIDWFTCNEDFNSAGNLFCDGGGLGKFIMNTRNKRFVMSYTLGYWTVGSGVMLAEKDEKSDTPSIEIGKCSPF